MKKKLIITLFIIILVIQSIMPIIVYADEEINTEIGTEGETKKQKKSIFDSSITFSWDTGKVNDLEYGMCIPSNANKYEKIPLILWLHGWINNQTVEKIIAKEDGIPYAVLGGSSLEKFSAYILCPKFHGNNMGQSWDSNKIRQLLDKIFEEYNVDRDNVVIIGHSFGAQNVPRVVNALPGYFSKAVICSGYYPTLLSIPTQWYVGSLTYAEDSEAIRYFNDVVIRIRRKDPNYEKNFAYKLETCGHGTAIEAYNKDNGEIGRYCK